MAVGWNDTFDGNTDFSSVATMNMFIAATNERFYYSGGPAGFPIASVSAGGDFQALTVIQSLQNAISGGIGLYRVPDTSADGRTWDGVEVSPVPLWSWSAYKTAHLGGNEWTRRYPREFASVTATAYLDGSAFANGHTARRIDNGSVYTRAAGAWSLASSGTLPDTVTAHGVAADGDYIGSWLFTEIRDALNRMIWMLAGSSSVSGNTQTAYLGGGGDPSWTVAQGQADASYSADSGSSSFSFIPAAYTHGFDLTEIGAFYHTEVVARAASQVAHAVGPAQTSANPSARFEFYVVMDDPSGTGDPAFFDPQGDGWSYRVWTKYDTKSQAGSATSTGATIGHGHTPEPSWCAAPAVGTIHSYLGYYAAQSVIIQRMDVAGGFTYRP